MKVVATIEARMNSTRLPGKVLKKIGGMPSLELQIKRMKRSNLIDEIVLATTDQKEDDILVDFAEYIGVASYRGSEEDVLSRILGAVQSVKGELHVQTTGDCPLIDPGIIDEVIQAYINNREHVDFVSNEIERSYPIGLDCRVFPVSVLKEVDQICKDPIHRIHGTTYIYAGPEAVKYRCKNMMAPDNLYHPDWRWTLDTSEDLEFFRVVCSHFSECTIELTAGELAAWLKENPHILMINSHVVQKELRDG